MSAISLALRFYFKPSLLPLKVLSLSRLKCPTSY